MKLHDLVIVVHYFALRLMGADELLIDCLNEALVKAETKLPS